MNIDETIRRIHALLAEIATQYNTKPAVVRLVREIQMDLQRVQFAVERGVEHEA